MAMDDFGTGFSLLAHLLRITVHGSQFHRCFVRDIPRPLHAAAVALAVIAMAKSLGVTVIAEGVETEAQLEFLRDSACDEMQGFYFSRPLPSQEFEVLSAPGAWPELCRSSAAEDKDDGAPTLLLRESERSQRQSLLSNT